MFNLKEELYEAVEANDCAKVEDILKRFNLRRNEFYGQMTYVAWAVLKNNEKIVRKLLENGADSNRLSYVSYASPNNHENYQNLEPVLITATRHENFEMCRLLLSYGAKVDKTDSRGFSALHWACILNNLQIVQCLIEHNAGQFLLDQNNQSPIEKAIVNNNAEIVSFLATFTTNETYRKCLICAIQSFNSHIFNILIGLLKRDQVNLDLNFIDDKVGSLLHYAVILNPIENKIDEKASIVKALLDNGLEVNLVNRFGETALHVCRDIEVARLLLNKGADMNICEITGKMPLFTFLLRANYDICVEMIRSGCEVENSDRLGNSLLFTIINSNAPVKIILLLLEAGVDFNEIWLKRRQLPKRLVQNYPRLVSFIEWRKRNPASLKELCRKSLRLHLNKINRSKSIMNSVNQLEKMIPSSLQDYVLLNFNKLDTLTMK